MQSRINHTVYTMSHLIPGNGMPARITKPFTIQITDKQSISIDCEVHASTDLKRTKRRSAFTEALELGGTSIFAASVSCLAGFLTWREVYRYPRGHERDFFFSAATTATSLFCATYAAKYLDLFASRPLTALIAGTTVFLGGSLFLKLKNAFSRPVKPAIIKSHQDHDGKVVSFKRALEKDPMMREAAYDVQQLVSSDPHLVQFLRLDPASFSIEDELKELEVVYNLHY